MSMAYIPVFIAAVAPGVALLFYFYMKDRYVTEPISMVGKVFLIGVLLLFPTLVIQRGLYLWLGEFDWITAFAISGGLEEFLKWFVVYFYIFKHRNFDEPYDGIVYGVAVSLGYATFENVIYAWSVSMDASALLLRAVLPVSAHALFAVQMGYYFGKARFSPPTSAKRYLRQALWVPLIWHGLYDYILLIFETTWIWYMLPLMIVLWVRALIRVKQANEKSPHRIHHEKNRHLYN